MLIAKQINMTSTFTPRANCPNHHNLLSAKSWYLQ